MRLHGKGISQSHGARPVYQNHLDDKMDSDQEVVNKELSLGVAGAGVRQQEPHVPADGRGARK